MPTAAIYCRLSWSPDGSVEKVERQEADCRALAQRLGWTVHEDHVYSDNHVSAWKRDRRRPGWESMLTAIRQGHVDAIVVYHGDRLVRQPWDLEQLLQLAEQRHIQLASVSGVRDLGSADDRFVLRIEVAQACKSSDDTSRRIKRGWAARAQRGLPVGGGRRPFGFEPDGVTIRESEAKMVAAAAERLLAGQPIGGVVAWLNSECVTSTGGRWGPRGLKMLLSSPRVAGLVRHDGQLLTGVWEPIIPVEEWEELRSLFEHSAKRYPYQGRQRRYLLAGIAECYRCERGMSTKPSGGRNQRNRRLYFCRHCRSMGRNQEHLDAYVIGRVLHVVNQPGFLDEVTASSASPELGAEIAALERRRAEARAQLDELADHPELSPQMIVRSLESFDRRIGELRAQQAATSRDRLLTRIAGIDREGWDALPLDVRSEAVRALFRVIVLPATWRGPGFDPASVRLKRV